MTISLLTIAGSDPSGGAGIQVDIKTCMLHKVYSMAIPTCLTVQNTLGIKSIHTIDPQIVLAQYQTLLEDLSPTVIKIGALGTRAVIETLLPYLENFSGKIIWDPVLISSSGSPLLCEEGMEFAKEYLTPLCTLVTPNHSEAEYLMPVLSQNHCSYILTDGEGHSPIAIDRLFYQNTEYQYTHIRYDRKNTHGTGCTLSTSIACNIAMGHAIPVACREAIMTMERLIKQCDEHNLGKGHGALGHEFL